MAHHSQGFSRMRPCQRWWNSAVIFLLFCLSLHACSCVFQISALSTFGLRLDLLSSGALPIQGNMHGPDFVKVPRFTSCKHLVVRACIVVSRMIGQMAVFGTLTLLYWYHKKSSGATTATKEGVGKTLSNTEFPDFSFSDRIGRGSTKSEFHKCSTSSTAKNVPKKAFKSTCIRKGLEQSTGSADVTSPSGPLNLLTDTVCVRGSDLKQAISYISNHIGESRYRPVYFRRLPTTQIDVSVKVQATKSHKGALALANEVNDILSRAMDPNLVLLIGYRGAKSAYILVYELPCGGTLQDRLYGIKFLRCNSVSSSIHRDTEKSGDVKVIDSGIFKFLGLELLGKLPKSRIQSLRGDGAGTPGQTRSKGESNVRRLISKSKSVVVPATTTDHPLWLPLTNLDRVVNPTFVSVIFVYENVLNEKGYGKTFKDVTTSLKDSLAKALVEFYPLAGRLTMKESGHVDLQCNDAGAIFIEASLKVQLSQLEGPGPMPMLSGMDFMNNVVQMAPGLQYIPDQINPEIPVLVIQVSRFTCGSVAVAINWHHTVADGFSGCHFVRSWAAIANDQALDLRPSFDRHLLQPRSPTDGSRVNNGNYGSSPACNQTSDILNRRQNTVAVTAPIIKPFALKKDTVQRLKDGLNNPIKVASNSSGVPRPFTSVESISAELWKLITKARSLIHDEEARRARSRFFMFVDGRKKLGLPPGYFGNVVCSACAETTQDELLKRPLSYAASLIQTATKSIDREYFRSLIDWVDERGSVSSKGCESEHVHSSGNDVAATFWISFPLYEINFGWGKPIMSFRNAPPRKLIDGIAMMPDPKGLGNMVALLNLHQDRMVRLEQDPEFRNTAELLDSKNTRSEAKVL